MNNQMKLINQSVELYKQEDFTLKGIYKAIEYAGRCCYNSYDKITPDSYKSFIEMLRKNKHYSPFSFGTVHIKLPKRPFLKSNDPNKCSMYSRILNKVNDRVFYNTSLEEFFDTVGWSRVYNVGDFWIITTNARVLEEYIVYFGFDELNSLSLFDVVKPFVVDDQKDYFEERPFVKCTTSIAMTRELNRHSTSLSICEKSSRYTTVDTAIRPYWFGEMASEQKEYFINSIHSSFRVYEEMLESGMQKQQARDVLPLATTTEVCYCAFKDDWYRVLDQRTGKGVHPQMKELATLISNEI